MSLESHHSSRRDKADDFDDLFDYDVDAAIPDLELEVNNLTASSVKPSNPGSKSKEKVKDDLGVDEEVKVRKQRVIVKLDADRLLSEQGLPRLKRAPQELTPKLKGKGHEYKDAARILNYYQLWADDLFRKGNFRDTLAIIEKLGHGKRVQIARHELVESFYKTEGESIEKNKEFEQTSGPAPAGRTQIQGDAAPEEVDDGALFHDGGDSDSDREIRSSRRGGNGDGIRESGIPDDDELDALIQMEAEAAETRFPKENTAPSIFGGTFESSTGAAPPAFVGYTNARTTSSIVNPVNQALEPTPPTENAEGMDEFDDDFDMDDWDAVNKAQSTQSNGGKHTTSGTSEDPDKTRDPAIVYPGETNKEKSPQSQPIQEEDGLDELEAMYGII